MTRSKASIEQRNEYARAKRAALVGPAREKKRKSEALRVAAYRAKASAETRHLHHVDSLQQLAKKPQSDDDKRQRHLRHPAADKDRRQQQLAKKPQSDDENRHYLRSESDVPLAIKRNANGSTASLARDSTENGSLTLKLRDILLQFEELCARV